MDKPIQVKSVADAQQQFQKLQADAQANPAFQNWSNKLPLKPLAQGGVMLIVTDENGPQNYQLWMHNGKLTVYSHENINKVYEKEVLNGIIVPMNSGVNPITGGELNQIPKGQKGTGRNAEVIWGYDDPGAQVLHAQAGIITNAFHQPANMNPAMAIAMPKAVFDALQVQKNIAPLPRPAVRQAAEVPVTPPPKVAEQPKPVAAWGPTEAGVTAAKMKEILPPEEVGTREQFNKANIAAVAALHQIRATYQEGRAAGDGMSRPQIENVVSRYEKVYPDAGKIMRQAYNDMEKFKEPVRGPNPVFNKAHDDLAAAYNGARGQYSFVPQGSAPPTLGPSAAGVSEDKMKMMMPPGKIGSPTDFIAVHSAAHMALQQIKMTYWGGMPESEKMSRPQIEQVISAHEKTFPEFGKTLRTSYAEMDETLKGNIMERTNGPVRVFDKGIAELSKSYNAHVHEFQPKPEIPKMPPLQAELFMAQRGDVEVSVARGTLFMTFINKDQATIAKSDAENVLKSYDQAFPKLGDIMHRMYDQMIAAKTPEERHERFSVGLNQMREFMRNPSGPDKGPAIQANVNEDLANRMFAAAQVPREEPLPETFERAAKNLPKEPEMAATVVADAQPVVVSASKMTV